MKIGIVCYPTYGGSGVVATELGKALAAAGHQVHFISYSQPARMDLFMENVFYHEVYISTYPLFQYPPYESALTSRLVDIVKNEGLDLLHVHYAVPHASAAIFARHILAQEGIYIPVITTLHGTDITLVGKDPTYSPIITYSINQSDGVTTVSESLKNDTLSRFQIDRPITVIPNFIDFSKFARSNKEHFKRAIAPNGESLIIHTSNFRKVKRVDDVVRIFNIIQEQIPAKLLLIGDGPERFNIESLSRELGLQQKVSFLGKQDAIDEILSVSDLFLLPSEHESFGLAALEAMACELPVISSDTGGIPELNVNGETGFTLPTGDVQGMAEKAVYLLSNPEVMQEFKKNAYKRATLFDINKILPMYLKVYEDGMNGKV